MRLPSAGRFAGLLVLMLTSSVGHCGVRFLAHYNKSLDADVAAGAPEAKVEGVHSTSGGKGYPFANSAPAAEAADIGYTTPAAPNACLSYSPDNIDVRQGTIQMWVKTSWDWDNPGARRADQDRMFFCVPLTGGIYNSINFYFACGQGFAYVPNVAFYIHDGKRDYMCCAPVGPNAPTDFDWRRDTWHYFVLTWTPRRMTMHADGKLLVARDFDIPMSLTPPEGPMVIGNHCREFKHPADALIDEVRILDFPLEGDASAFAMPKMELGDTIQGEVVAVGGPAQQYHPELRRYFAYRCAVPPTLDGDLSDPAWQDLPAAGGFMSLEGQRLPVPEQTEAKACYDDTNLYLAVRCHEDAVAALEANAKQNQDMAIFSDDAVEVFLSSEAEGVPCLQLGVNPANKSCALFYGKGVNGPTLDKTWQGSFQTAARKGEREWTVEIAIPLADLAKVVPKIGDGWRWNVCRDRRAGVGLQYSTMNFITAGFLSPREYGHLIFADRPQRAPAVEEADLNRDYLAWARQETSEFADQITRELRLVARVAENVKRTAGLADMEKTLTAQAQRLHGLAGAKTSPGLTAWNAAQLSIKGLRRQLSDFAFRAAAVGPAASVNIAGAPRGMSKRGGCYLLVSDDLALAVDASSGAVAGVWEKRTGRRLVTGAYDIYQAETRDREWRSDERMDVVKSAAMKPDRVELVCTNPDLPGVEIVKRYWLASVGKEPRAACRRVEIRGSAPMLTLLKISSNAIFDRGFRDRAYYDRVFPIGTTGDKRSQAWARDITEPIMERAWFNSTEGRAQFDLVDPTTHTGLAEYLYKVNDRWAYPQGFAQSYWTPYGWEMGYAGTFVHPTKGPGARPAGVKASFETRYHLFHGDHLVYHREYMALPEHAAIRNDWTPDPRVLRIKAQAGAMIETVTDPDYAAMTFGELTSMTRPDEITVALMGQADNRWGVWPTGDAEQIIHLDPAGREIDRVPCTKLKQEYTDLHRLFPRCLGGPYQFPNDIYSGAEKFKRHPQWILRDKFGHPCAGGFGPIYGPASWSPEFVADLTKSLLQTMDYYGADIQYLDLSVGMIMADWQRGEVVQLSVYQDFLKNLYAELHRRGKMLWLNSFVDQYYFDIGYHECDGAQVGWSWRDGAAIDLARKLYTRPGTVCIPLYWLGGEQFVAEGRANEDRYRNLVLGCGLVPTGCWLDPYAKAFPRVGRPGTADFQACYRYQMAVHFAGAELIPSEFAEIGLSPAHWRDFDSDYETYTLRQGPAYLLNVISHKQQAGDAIFAVDPALMGLKPGRPIFFWQFQMRDPKTFPKQAPAPSNWDRLFSEYRCQLVEPKGKTLRLTMAALPADVLRMSAITQVPGFVYSASGKLTQLLLPEVLGCKLTGDVDLAGRTVRVRAAMSQPGEVLVWAPREWARLQSNISGDPMDFGGQRFLRVALPKGTSEVVVRSG